MIKNIGFKQEKLGIYTFKQIQQSWKNTFGSVGINEGRGSNAASTYIPYNSPNILSSSDVGTDKPNSCKVAANGITKQPLKIRTAPINKQVSYIISLPI